MSKYIELSDFPLMGDHLYSKELCSCGSGLRKSLQPRPKNTAYLDPEMNWLQPCCDECFADCWNYYVDAWDDYESGR